MKPATLITTILLGVISVGHILRLVIGLTVVAAGVNIPMWISVLGVIVPALLAVGIVREHRPSAG